MIELPVDFKLSLCVVFLHTVTQLSSRERYGGKAPRLATKFGVWGWHGSYLPWGLIESGGENFKGRVYRDENTPPLSCCLQVLGIVWDGVSFF